MASKRRKALKIRAIGKEKESRLLKDTIKKIRETNQRLKSLERGGYKETYASKKLMEKLDISTLKMWDRRSGRVKLPKKDITQTQLIALNKQMTSFLESKTSTKKGINEVKKATKESIKETLSEEQGKRVSDEDVDFYYSTFGDSDFNDLTAYMTASELWALIDYGIAVGMEKTKWVDMLLKHIERENDLDIREKAERLYEKYIA